MKDYNRAIDYVKQWIVQNPRHFFGFCFMGRMMRELGRLSEAVRCYQIAVQLSPQLLTAHVELSKLLHAQGRHIEAINSLHRVR
jgi:protein O-GlcNAc transferase